MRNSPGSGTSPSSGKRRCQRSSQVTLPWCLHAAHSGCPQSGADPILQVITSINRHRIGDTNLVIGDREMLVECLPAAQVRFASRATKFR